jgi:AP-2 complex subunit mu-1
LGKAKYSTADNLIIWRYVDVVLTASNASIDGCAYRIPRIQGQSDITFTAEAIRSSTTHQKPWSRPPIAVDFQVLMFTASGLAVRFLKVFEKSNYNSVKWVRYLTKANGTYQIRVSSLSGS